MATTMRRPGPGPGPAEMAPSRAALRKQRLLELENEQRLEDAEALKMTEEQRLSLFHSFRSVKFEWSDLDGMRSVRRRYNSPPPRTQCHPNPTPYSHSLHTQPQHQPYARPAHLQLAATTPIPIPAPAPSSAFAVLTNARLATFGADDTICVRASFPGTPATPFPDFPATPTPHSYLASPPPSAALTSPATPTPHSPSSSAKSKSPPSTGTRAKLIRTSKARKARSPVKGLFACAFPAPPPHTPASPASPPGIPHPHPHPIRVPLPPLAAVALDPRQRLAALLADPVARPIPIALPLGDGDADADGDGDEDEWVDEDEDAFGGDADEDVDADECALPTPRAGGWAFDAPLRVAVGSNLAGYSNEGDVEVEAGGKRKR
ncbi:hypothetical protein DFH07DRAFT_1066084 [Mycena maculata]|uniref:Uncharacterized protein n=1 Tax=Mycena maculata TaxID=230809 RepID=A0AAD7HY90_9AGAR|nr:hypothetical protein DFH07DRAFT_1066084 [Mycena maculata]